MSSFSDRPTTPVGTPAAAPARPVKTPKSEDVMGAEDDADLDTSIVSVYMIRYIRVLLPPLIHLLLSVLYVCTSGKNCL